MALCFGVGAILGAPFLPVRGDDTKALVDFARLRPGQTLMDLGSGDGRLLREAARRGYRAIGYEINPLIYAWSVVRCWPQRQRITIHLGDFWQADLSSADAITVFLIGRYMGRLDHKLKRELTKPTRVVSYIFDVPGREPIESTRNTYVYEYGKDKG